MTTTKQDRVRAYDLGHVIDHLMRSGMCVREMHEATHIAMWRLYRWHAIYLNGNMTTTIERSVAQPMSRLERAAKERHLPDDAYVSDTMRRRAREGLKRLNESGLTVSHICRECGISSDVFYGYSPRMRAKTYRAIMDMLPSLQIDAQHGIGTSTSAERRRKSSFDDLVSERRSQLARDVRRYVRAHPDATRRDIEHDLGISRQMLSSIDVQFDVLPIRDNKLKLARWREEQYLRMRSENPHLKDKDIAERLGMSKSSLSTMKGRLKTAGRL